MDWPRVGWGAFRRIQALLEAEDANGKSITELKDAFKEVVVELRELEKRVHRFEIREDVVIDTARSAARDSSAIIATGLLGDMARRIGVLEETSQPPPPPTRKLRTPRLKAEKDGNL